MNVIKLFLYCSVVREAFLIFSSILKCLLKELTRISTIWLYGLGSALLGSLSFCWLDKYIIYIVEKWAWPFKEAISFYSSDKGFKFFFLRI